MRAITSSHLPYTAQVTQRLADQRAEKTNKRKLDKLKNQQWSLEQIADRLKERPPDDEEIIQIQEALNNRPRKSLNYII